MEWIEKLPKVISMQMNRLKYEGGNAVKELTPMIIEPTIYPDRFLVQNRDECEKIRKEVQSLRDKIKLLEGKLREYQHFEGSDYNLKRVLELASLFFKQQSGAETAAEAFDQLQLFSPLQQANFG